MICVDCDPSRWIPDSQSRAHTAIHQRTDNQIAQLDPTDPDPHEETRALTRYERQFHGD